MKGKQAVKFLTISRNNLEKERKRLRSILNEAANCISYNAHGHTPNWGRLVQRIEKYEDKYSPLADIN